MDFSFLALYNSIEDSLNDDLFKDRQISMYISMQLFIDEAYSQKTNYEGGISFDDDYTCDVVDFNNVSLKNITNHIFTEEFIDENGNNQIKVEIVNINEDFFGQCVFLRFKNNVSNDYYYTKPLIISNKNSSKTYRFDYKNSYNLHGLSYESSGFWQSIRLKLSFKDFNNKSEISDYRQSSTGNTISGLDETSIALDYILEQIDTFTFVRLQKLLFHDIIYIDGVRITNKPLLEQGGRIGRTNLLKANFTAYKSNSDKKEYEYQIFDGLNITDYEPIGNHTLSSLPTGFNIEFNINVLKNDGNIYLYDSTNTLLYTFTNDEFNVTGQSVTSDNILNTIITQNGSYYFLMDSGLFESETFGIEFEGISDPNIWTFTVQDADYSSTDYNTNDYFTD